ncbi:hypothetical protein PHYPSEUDO_014348 [Phytophthora pseudosyringae]|uniref:Uncharacterized protein n=1 Tax=Phytophthora pseudosyringae TaxID=221518 RepID=A0A8T1WI56_9STRA|nr:hypothetical protein PHYPSEUDO_014348 [Phytophthora pseudosyringae]
MRCHDSGLLPVMWRHVTLPALEVAASLESSREPVRLSILEHCTVRNLFPSGMITIRRFVRVQSLQTQSDQRAPYGGQARASRRMQTPSSSAAPPSRGIGKLDSLNCCNARRKESLAVTEWYWRNRGPAAALGPTASGPRCRLQPARQRKATSGGHRAPRSLARAAVRLLGGRMASKSAARSLEALIPAAPSSVGPKVCTMRSQVRVRTCTCALDTKRLHVFRWSASIKENPDFSHHFRTWKFTGPRRLPNMMSAKPNISAHVRGPVVGRKARRVLRVLMQLRYRIHSYPQTHAISQAPLKSNFCASNRTIRVFAQIKVIRRACNASPSKPKTVRAARSSERGSRQAAARDAVTPLVTAPETMYLGAALDGAPGPARRNGQPRFHRSQRGRPCGKLGRWPQRARLRSAPQK